MFIAESQGYFNPKLTMEDVRDNWGQITDRSEFSVPNSTPRDRHVHSVPSLTKRNIAAR